MNVKNIILIGNIINFMIFLSILFVGNFKSIFSRSIAIDLNHLKT